MLQNPTKYLVSGGGLIAFAFSASQTTLLSFYVAHHSDVRSLAVFGFLLSVHYFAIQLLRRNVIEPYYEFQEIARISQNKKEIALIFLFVILIFTFSFFVSGFFKLTLCMFTFSVVSIIWEMRKATLRFFSKIHIYTSFEFALVLLLVFIIILDIAGYYLQNEFLILGLALLQIIFLFLTRFFSKDKSSENLLLQSHVKISVNSQGEFIYLSAIICSNAYLLYQDYSVQLGEIRSIFLFLLVSTFSVSALRNSLSFDLQWTKVNNFLLLTYFGNILILFLIPEDILRNLIPSFPLDSGFLIVIVSLDTVGSLIYLLLSLHLLKKRNMRSSANARLLSTCLLTSSFIFFLNENLSVIQISLIFAVSSLAGAVYLLLVINFARFKGRFWSVS